MNSMVKVDQKLDTTDLVQIDTGKEKLVSSDKMNFHEVVLKLYESNFGKRLKFLLNKVDWRIAWKLNLM